MAKTCDICKAKLSQYNPGNLCHLCQEKKKAELEKKMGTNPHYSLDNMCFLLGLAEESVKRLGRKGKIPGRVPGVKRHLYFKEAINQWILKGDTHASNQASNQGQQDTAEEKLLLQRQQNEHIKELQEVARSFIDSIPKTYPDLSSRDEFVAFYLSLSKLFRRLTGDVRWPDLAIHLNSDTQELEEISRDLDPFITTGLESIPESPHRRLIDKAWGLIPGIYVCLMIIAESADTREWEYYGLKQRCPGCQEQTYVPVDTTDLTADLPGPQYILRIPKNADVPESWRKLIEKQKGHRFTGPKIYLDYRQFLS